MISFLHFDTSFRRSEFLPSNCHCIPFALTTIPRLASSFRRLTFLSTTLPDLSINLDFLSTLFLHFRHSVQSIHASALLLLSVALTTIPRFASSFRGPSSFSDASQFVRKKNSNQNGCCFSLNGNWCFNSWVWIIALNRKIFELYVKN